MGTNPNTAEDPIEYVTINDTEIPVLAYMHATVDTCVTAAIPDGHYVYANPRKLVDIDDVLDQVDWLEKGIEEWRTVALIANAKAKGQVVVPLALYRAWQGLLLLEGSSDEVNASIYRDIIKNLMQDILPKEE